MGGLVRTDGHGPLSDDVAPVGVLGHVVERDARLRLAVQHRPVHAGPPSVTGQERAVHIKGPQRREAQDGHGKHGPVVKRKNHVRRGLPNALHAGLLRQDRQAVGTRQVIHRIEPTLLIRIILMGIDQRNVHSPPQQDGQTLATNRTISEHNRFAHSYPPP